VTAIVTTNATHLTQPVNFVLMKGLLQAARKKLPYFNGTLPGELIKMGGSSAVKWERINNLAAVTTALGEFVGTSAFLFGRALVTPTYSSVTATAAKYGNAIQVTEEVDLFNVNTRSARLLDTLGANAGESLNTIAKAEYDNATTNVRASNGSAGGTTASKSYVTSKLTAVDIQFAVNKLNLNAAMPFTPMATGSRNIGTNPIRAAYYGICHVDVEEDIRKLAGSAFVAVETYGGYTETMPFEFGHAYGVRWCSTQVSTINLSAGKKTAAAGYRGSSTILNDVYTSYIYGREAIGTVGLGNMHASNSYEMYNPKYPPAVDVIFKPAGSAGAGDPYNEIASLAWKAWFVAKILNQNWIVKLFGLATKL
jgi:N4-gp56 family major capsid protein